MTANYLLSLDVGGGGGRCLLINVETREVTISSRAWRHPATPGGGQWSIDLDTRGIWGSLAEMVKEALAGAGARPEQVAGIAATGMRHGLVFLGAEGEVLLARANTDARAVSQSMALNGEHGERLYQRSGHWPSPICMAPFLLWMKENRPDALKAAQSVLSVSDWGAYQLSGELAFEASQAAESLLFDIRARGWADDLIAEFGLRRDIFPPIGFAGERMGVLQGGAAAHLGLLEGTPVARGGADTQSGLLGMGALAPGQLGVIAGTTAPVQMVVDQAHIDPQRRLWTSVHLLPGLYVLESNAGGMGNALEWFARALYPGLPDPIGALMAEARNAPAGAGGIFSTVGASVFNAAEMGLPIDSLTLSTTTAHPGNGERALLARAIAEGLAYAVLANIEQIGRVAGGAVDRICLGGGISRSQTLTELVSQVTGAEVRVADIQETTALGAAICAGVGAGLYPDLASGAGALVRYSRQHAPGEDQHRSYRALYQDWAALRQERASVDELAASIFTQSMRGGERSADVVPEEAFRPRIFVSADMCEMALDTLRELGEVTYASYREGAMLVGEELVETLQDYQVFVTEVDMLDAEALQGLPDLRMVAACRGAPVNVDVEACTAAGVPVVNTPGRNADAVADLTVSFMLMLARKLGEAAAFLRQPGGEAGDMGRMGQAYFSYQGHELWNKQIGIVGAGAIGRRVIKRLLPFEARLLVYDPYIDAEEAALLGARVVGLDELLLESDFISLHAPVTDETRQMIDAAAFERMKPGAFLANTARAALVDEVALIAALETGELGGAALDVFSVEPPGSDDPLLAFPNVIATPHLGGNTFEVGVHQGMIVASELRRLLSGAAPENILNPEALEGFTWTGARRVSQAELEKLAAGPGPSVSDLDAGAAQERQQADREAPSGREGGLFKRLFRRKEAQERAPLVPADQSDGSQRETLIRILEQFCANICSDEKMAAASSGKNVVMHFTVKDLDQDFYLNFQDGEVDAGLGEPPLEPDVRLKMNAEILDGMFTGRISGNKAAMTGKLSFSGDTRKAMAFQRFTRDMERLYQAAREAVGDPGDLTRLGVAPAAGVGQPPGASAVPGTPPAGYAPQAPLIIKVGDVRDEILQVNNELYARGLITATGGNVSARTDDNPNEVWITPSAIFKGDLRADMMVRIDLSGNLVGESEYSASSERRVHCAIYRARPDISAVIHTHAPQATVMALTGARFLPISTEAAFVGEVPVVPFIMPGTDELGEEVARALGQGVAVIMGNHGLVVAGSSPRRAADMTEIVESTAEKILTCKALGVEPVLLPEDVLEELREIGKMLV
jgi:autoinducer 2 (AI-2) kinase